MCRGGHGERGLHRASASAAISSVLGGQTVSGQAIACTTQPDGTRVCQGDFSSSGGPDTRLKSFDGTPLALYVILPPAPRRRRRDGGYPLVAQSHGWGQTAGGPDSAEYLGPTGGSVGARRVCRAAAHGARVGATRAAARPRAWPTPRAAPTATSASTTTATRSATCSTRSACSSTRGWSNPDADRRHRRVLRRRGLARAGDAARPRDERRRVGEPVAQPGRNRAAHRRRGAGHPVERPRLLADAQRAHARLSGRLAYHGPVADRRREAVVRLRPVRARLGVRVLCPRRHELAGRSHDVVCRAQRGRAV